MKSTHRLCIILTLLALAQQLEFYKQRFKENQHNRSLLTLPILTQQLTYQQELDQYAQLHHSPQFLQFKPDPQLSSKILLKKTGPPSQSLFFTGRQLNILSLQISVIHKGDPHNHDKDSIDVYLLNYETNQILLSQKVKHIKLFQAEVVSQLYELIIRHDWPDKLNINSNSTEEASKYISISIAIVPPATPLSRDDAATTAEKLAVIKSETDRIFINSLDIWQQISKHHEQHYANQQQVYLRAYFQLLIVFALNFVELMLIRRTLKLQPLI